MPSRVPGSIYTDLWRNGTIGNPYRGTNDVLYRWIGRTAWRFEKRFRVPMSFHDNDRQVILEADGIDTVCNMTLNGVHFASVENQFRRYRFEVQKLLKVGLTESGDTMWHTLGGFIDAPTHYIMSINLCSALINCTKHYINK